MKLSNLTTESLQVALLIMDGATITHDQTSFKRGASVDRDGLIDVFNGVSQKVSSDNLDEIEDAGIPLNTYQPNINAPWKTCLPRNLSRSERDSIINELLTEVASRVKDKINNPEQQLDEDALLQSDVFDPIISMMASKIIRDGYNPFDANNGFDWFNMADSFGGEWIDQFRNCVREYLSNPGTMLPGEMAMRSILEKYGEERVWDACDVEEVKIARLTSVHDDDDGDEVPVFEWLEHFVSACLAGTDLDGEHVSGQLESAIKDLANQGWIEDAVQSGIPSSVHAEFVYFPTWTPEIGDLDDAIYHLGLRTSANSTYIDELLPCEGLKRFLEYVNVSPAALIEAATVRNPNEGAKLAENLAGFGADVNPASPSLVAPSDVLTILENTGSTNSIPTVHAHIELRALFELDPSQPVALPLRKNCMHIGFHDFVNGAGYMDTYPGTAIVDLNRHHFAGDRYAYGINDTYGLALSAFYCTPENIAGPQEQSDETPRPRG